MRSGAWCCLGAGIWVSACSGDYPLAPTVCDDYCHSTRGLQCGFYSPASCVTECERDLMSDAACRPQLNAVMSCFDTTGALEKRCLAYQDYPLNIEDAELCDAPIGELYVCSSTLRVENDQM